MAYIVMAKGKVVRVLCEAEQPVKVRWKNLYIRGIVRAEMLRSEVGRHAWGKMPGRAWASGNNGVDNYGLDSCGYTVTAYIVMAWWGFGIWEQWHSSHEWRACWDLHLKYGHVAQAGMSRSQCCSQCRSQCRTRIAASADGTYY